MRLVHDGNTKVRWLPAVVDIEAPTVAEIAAGTDLTPQLPSDGLTVTPNRNKASQSMLDSSFVAEAVGNWSVGIVLKFQRDVTSITTGAGDAAYTLFDRGTDGFLLVSRFGAPAAGDQVEVYPAEAHQPIPLATAENAYQQFEVELAITDEPALKAVVAA